MNTDRLLASVRAEITFNITSERELPYLYIFYEAIYLIKIRGVSETPIARISRMKVDALKSYRKKLGSKYL